MRDPSGVSPPIGHDFPKPLRYNVWSLAIMPDSTDHPDRRSQLFTFCETPKPDFWFGDIVNFQWNNENTGQAQLETGEVVGVVWNFSNKQWRYFITWLSSSVYRENYYPMFDDTLHPAEGLLKA